MVCKMQLGGLEKKCMQEKTKCLKSEGHPGDIWIMIRDESSLKFAFYVYFSNAASNCHFY